MEKLNISFKPLEILGSDKLNDIVEKVNEIIDDPIVAKDSYVRYTEQSLTEAQKSQARRNIGIKYNGDEMITKDNIQSSFLGFKITDTETKSVASGIWLYYSTGANGVRRATNSTDNTDYFNIDYLPTDTVLVAKMGGGTYNRVAVLSDTSDAPQGSVWDYTSTNATYITICDKTYISKGYILINVGKVKALSSDYHYVAFTHAKNEESGLYAIDSKKVLEWLNVRLANLDNEVSARLNDLPVTESFFANEIETTVNRIKQLTSSYPSVSLCQLTDLHWRTKNTAYTNRLKRTLNNMWSVCRKTNVDGCIFLGDLLAQDWADEVAARDTQDKVNEALEEFATMFGKCHPYTYLMLGNHDGIGCSVPQGKGMYGSWFKHNDRYVVRENANPYYYFDFAALNVRCICLATPDPTNSSDVWTFSEGQIKWLERTLKSLADGWQVLVFTHLQIYNQSGKTPMWNYESIEGMLNAFNNHTSFSNSLVSVNFSSYKTSKVVAMIAGHSHYDKVIRKGDSYFTNYNLDFPCIVTDKGMTYGNAESTTSQGGHINARTLGTVTEDLWDTIIYRPDLSKIYMVRFGAGDDRVIDV